MVNPIYIFIIALGVAFFLSIFDRFGRHISVSVFLLALLAMTLISGTWAMTLPAWDYPFSLFTAGFEPPFSINLQLGIEEAFFLFFTNLLGLLGALYLLRKFQNSGVFGMILFLMMIMGINGIIMTRDLFNLFVFMEITSIATYSIIGLEQDSKTLSAGFKYVIAGGLATFFFLLGTIFSIISPAH